EERGAMRTNVIENELRPVAGLDALLLDRQRAPQRGVTARDQRDRRGAPRRRRLALAAVRPSVARSPRARPQPRPGDMPREAAIVQPSRLVAAEPRRQDLALPGAGGRLK